MRAACWVDWGTTAATTPPPVEEASVAMTRSHHPTEKKEKRRGESPEMIVSSRATDGQRFQTRLPAHRMKW